jgi:hypothetical protein
MRYRIPLSDVKFGLVVHEEPAKESLYLKAGAPTRCRACQKPWPSRRPMIGSPSPPPAPKLA